MDLLRTLTLAYAGVLVLALALSLIGILVYLRRIGRALGEVRQSLVAAEEATRPLAGHLAPLDDETRAAAASLARARTDLEHADAHLGTVAARLGVFVSE